MSRIGRVVLAGNLVMPVDSAIFKEKHLTQKQQEDLATPMRTLDLLLTQVQYSRERGVARCVGLHVVSWRAEGKEKKLNGWPLSPL